MKKYLQILICPLLLCVVSCGKAEEVTNEEVKEETEVVFSDMSGYETYNENETYVFYDMDVMEMNRKMDEGDTFVVYFGFDTCPWCNDAMPILNTVAKSNGVKVGYVNTRKEESWSSNKDIDNYALLIERAAEFLPKDEEGNPRLYVPFVFFVKNGVIVSAHEGTVAGHNAHERRIDNEETVELSRLYQKGFDKLKS